MLSEKLTRRQLLFALPTIPMAMLGKVNQSQSIKVNKPKFSIGDRVEAQGCSERGDAFWERGIIKGIIGPDWDLNSTEDGWLYYYVIEETSYSLDFTGFRGEAFEDELRLIG